MPRPGRLYASNQSHGWRNPTDAKAPVTAGAECGGMATELGIGLGIHSRDRIQ
jgi:hypothetical protein